ncbi:hypothetical protein AVEN_274706-1, partial [Araneus ventricosus]
CAFMIAAVNKFFPYQNNLQYSLRQPSKILSPEVSARIRNWNILVQNLETFFKDKKPKICYCYFTTLIFVHHHYLVAKDTWETGVLYTELDKKQTKHSLHR